MMQDDAINTLESIPDMIVSDALGFRPLLNQYAEVYEQWSISICEGKSTVHHLDAVIDQTWSLLKAFHQQRIDNFSSERIQFELSSLKHVDNMDCALFEDISNDWTIVAIDIPLSVQTSSNNDVLVDSVTSPVSPHTIIVRLLVEFMFQHQIEHNSIEPFLTRIDRTVWLPKQWASKQHLFKLPPFTIDTSIITYIPTVEDALKEGLNVISNAVAKRKALIGALMNLCPREVLECDTTQYSMIKLYMETPITASKVTTTSTIQKISPVTLTDHSIISMAIAHVTLTDEFPIEAPHITLTSPIHVQPDGHTPSNCTTTIKWGTWVYNSRWQSDELAKKIRIMILNELPHFWQRLPPLTTNDPIGNGDKFS